MKTTKINLTIQVQTNGDITMSKAAQMAGRYEWMLDNMGQGGQYGAGRMMNGQAGVGGCGRYGGAAIRPPPSRNRCLQGYRAKRWVA
jgi:hypothetical protein